ncbi:benzil reductase ((S)-benzoin forming) [Lewinella marina]|nr:benzil reductase ((S)-benzoin forming) [Neolewinella marina]
MNLLAIREDLHIVGVSRSAPPDNVLQSNRFSFMQADLSEPKEVLEKFSEWVTTAVSGEGEIVFINNAGTINPIGFSASAAEELIQSVNINFLSPLLIYHSLVNAFAKVFLVNITSGAANNPIAGWEMYAATKSAMKMFCATTEASRPGSTHSIDPGVIDTQMQAQIRSSNDPSFARKDNFVKLSIEGGLQSPPQAAVRVLDELSSLSIL